MSVQKFTRLLTAGGGAAAVVCAMALPASASTQPATIGDCQEFTTLHYGGSNDVYCSGTSPSRFMAWVDCLGPDAGARYEGPSELAGNRTHSVAYCPNDAYLTNSGYYTG